MQRIVGKWEIIKTNFIFFSLPRRLTFTLNEDIIKKL